MVNLFVRPDVYRNYLYRSYVYRSYVSRCNKQIQCWLLTFFCFITYLYSPPVSAQWYEQQAEKMGTLVRVEIWHQDSTTAQQLIKKVLAEIQRIEDNMSPYIESSMLSQVNRDAANKRVKIDDELFFVINKSLEYAKQTNGAFDISYASVGHLYDYRAGKKPSKEELKKRLPAINYRSVVLDKNNKTIHFLHPDIKIDLGGIAKGYAVDRCIELLKRHGVTSSVVSAGGDSRLLGDRQGRPWYIGVKNPRGKGHLMKLPLVNVAVSTSGDYERFFEKDGERYHHIINPKTGTSSKNIQGVTIIADKAIDSDALSTSVFVLGRQKGLALIESLPNISAIVIEETGKVYYSSDLLQPDL